MKKDDILQKAQHEKKDERDEYFNKKAFDAGWTGVTAIMFFLLIWRRIHNETTTDIILIIVAQATAASFYQYAKMSEKKKYLIRGIFGIVALGLGFAALLSEYGYY